MADYDEGAIQALLEASENVEHELIQHLRGTLKQRVEPASDPRTAELEAELAGFRQDALFREAGIGTDGTGGLLRQALSGQEDLTVESIKAEAVKYGLVEGAPPAPGPNPATADEMAAHQAMGDVLGDVPPPPPDIEARMNAAQTIEELRALEREAGIVVDNEEFLDLGI